MVVLAFVTGQANAVVVQDVRVWAGPNSTRVVFDLSGPTSHSLLTLSDPDRVVIDIPSASAASFQRQLPTNQGFVKQIRVGEQGNGSLRVVIDLAANAKPKSFPVGPSGSYGHRLVVDLEPGAQRTPPKVVKSADDVHGRDIIIAIDAGHGGQDPGSIGSRGTFEKNVTLAIAKRLKDRIDREPGMRAVLTRDGDYFVPHRERIARARKHQADMFIPFTPMRSTTARSSARPCTCFQRAVRAMNRRAGLPIARTRPISLVASRSRTKTTC